jgi:hypothetical protein
MRSALPDDLLQAPGHGLQHLVSLTSVEADPFGEEHQVIWEIELEATEAY